MTKQRTMPTWNVAKKYRGTWWPAGSEEFAFPGVLRFDKRRPRLTLASPLIGQEIYELAHATVLHGTLASGEKVTLWDIQEHDLVFLRNRSTMKHRRRFTYAILGEHLEKYEEARFRYSAVRLHGLKEWSAMHRPIPRGMALTELPQYEPALLTNFHRDESGVGYSAEVRFENLRRLEQDHDNSGVVVASHTGEQVRVVFECTPPAPAQIHDLLLFDLQALLSFSYQGGGAPMQAYWLASQDLASPLPVMQRDAFTGQKPFGHVFSETMVLTTSALEPAELFPAWWKAVEELYPAVQVIYLYHHGSRGLLESSVAAVIAVAEHMHGIIGPTKTRFPAGFLESKAKDLKKAVKAAFPSPDDARFRLFLYESLGNNRPTLRTRLEELADAVTPERLALLEIDRDQWISDVMEVRNPIAHTSSHVSRRGSDSSNLLNRVNIATRAIVTILILMQMSLTDDALDQSARALRREVKRFPA